MLRHIIKVRILANIITYECNLLLLTLPAYPAFCYFHNVSSFCSNWPNAKLVSIQGFLLASRGSPLYSLQHALGVVHAFSPFIVQELVLVTKLPQKLAREAMESSQKTHCFL